ncbi:MAG: NAD(+) diphosphatase [Chloroflexi bacterium]|nr:NAD(+) diphosphatase [Chloroflexota bacterium]
MYPPHTFAANPLDRGEAERRDEDWIEAQARDSQSQFLPFSNLNVLLGDDPGPTLGWLSLDGIPSDGTTSTPTMLGMMDGATHFAIEVNEDAAAFIEDWTGMRFEDCRAAGETLPGPEGGIVAQARAQLDWHRRHRFCSVCGKPSEKRRGGQMRFCPACKAQHFPRTDPVVITVVEDKDGDRCLLGQSRGRLQRMRMYSALAGFMDQGEAIEEAVAREIMEEAGIQVKNVRYHSSQPWPFPSSLMIGCIAEAATTDINMDAEEMTDVQWFSRSEVLLALEGKSEKLAVPAPLAIAHHLIKTWAYGEMT